MIIEILTDTFLFVKENSIAILTAFFLVKGKFVIKLFIRKIILLSATGLGKRYMIEKVLNHQIKVHFLDHMKDDFKKLSEHIKDNFQNFPLVKKIMTVFVFIGSLGFVGKFMGGMLAVKVFIAKVWSFLLVVFLKLFAALFYFITKILWGNWLAPILEIVLFSWLLTWLEKVPFLKQGLNKIYQLFHYLFGWVEVLIARLMKAPLRRFLKWLVKNMKIAIYKFIGYERVSRFKRLQEERKRNPNSHTELMQKRKERILPRDYVSARGKLKQKREKRKPLNTIDF
ncbi:MAG: hypothetical protein J7J02_08405 [Sulfurovum sp.]|nr:hypothetical protein [Sulfurovum sp.]